MESNENPARDRRFWNELYWFVTLSLVGGMIALWVLPPRALETLGLLRKDRNLARAVAEAHRQEDSLRAAKTAAESDPYYRDRLRRAVLDVKKAGEEVIDLREPSP